MTNDVTWILKKKQNWKQPLEPLMQSFVGLQLRFRVK